MQVGEPATRIRKECAGGVPADREENAVSDTVARRNGWSGISHWIGTVVDLTPARESGIK